MLFLGALWVFSKLIFVYIQYLYSNVQQINLEGLNKTNNTITGSMNFIVGMKQILKLNSIKYEYSCSVAIFIVRHKIKQNQKKKRRYTRICPLWRSVLFDIKNTTTVRRWWWFFLRFCFEMKWQEQKIIPLLRKNLYIRRIWLNDAFIYFQNQIKCKSKDYHILKNLNIQQSTHFEYWNS